MKKRNRNRLRVIQISGIRGLLSALFVVTCLIAGFVGFPSIMLAKLWNYCADMSGTLPYINIFQGLILWAILAVLYMILNKKQRYLVAFEPTMNRREIRDIINEIKAQSVELKKDIPTSCETPEIKFQAEKSINEKEKEEEKTKEVV